MQEIIMTDPRLRKLQLCELDIFSEFIRICEKHNLEYRVMAGTLLGAVRHKGFIPWDDDIDVVMMREDYDRFAEICKDELNPAYFYQNSETDPYYFLTYAKLRKRETEVYEERFRNSKFHKGVFIDIFPLDYCPKPGPVCHLLFNTLAVMNYRGQVDSGETYEPYKELIGKIGYGVLRFFSPVQLVYLRKKLVQLSRALSRKQYVASYSGAYGYYKDVYPSEWYIGYTSVEFEGRQHMAPACSVELLVKVFGEDFMKIPKEEQRYAHIDLDKIKL